MRLCAPRSQIKPVPPACTALPPSGAQNPVVGAGGLAPGASPISIPCGYLPVGRQIQVERTKVPGGALVTATRQGRRNTLHRTPGSLRLQEAKALGAADCHKDPISPRKEAA